MKNILILFLIIYSVCCNAQDRGRLRDFGIEPGILTPGKYNAITDVEGVTVGQTTLIKGDSIRTGVTVVHYDPEKLKPE